MKLAPNALRFTIWNSKSCKPHEKQNKKYQNVRSIGDKLKTKSLVFFVSFFSCDMQDVNRKAFDSSFLYWVNFTTAQILIGNIN